MAAFANGLYGSHHLQWIRGIDFLGYFVAKQPADDYTFAQQHVLPVAQENRAVVNRCQTALPCGTSYTVTHRRQLKQLLSNRQYGRNVQNISCIGADALQISQLVFRIPITGYFTLVIVVASLGELCKCAATFFMTFKGVLHPEAFITKSCPLQPRAYILQGPQRQGAQP